jgi:hypothetical protein
MFARQLSVDNFIKALEADPNATVEVVRQRSACTVVDENHRTTTEPALVVVCQLQMTDGPKFVANETIRLKPGSTWEDASESSVLWKALKPRLEARPADTLVTQVHRSGSL